jgi:hypothetical protein
VEIIDQVSDNRLVNHYAYHHGYYDGYEREYRGFAMVETWDTEDFDLLKASNTDSWKAPPVHVKT